MNTNSGNRREIPRQHPSRPLLALDTQTTQTVTVLLILYPRLPLAQIVGSDIAYAVPLTLIAGVGHWYLGDVNFVLLLSLLIGSLPRIAIGSHVAARVPDKVLRPILAGTLAVVGGRLVA